jgi:hypothetical protein
MINGRAVPRTTEHYEQMHVRLERYCEQMHIRLERYKYRPPKTDQLLPLYQAARRLADKIGVDQWHLHFCAYNKMADTAANVAEDGRHSLQSFESARKTHKIGTLHVYVRLRQGDAFGAAKLGTSDSRPRASSASSITMR